MNTTKTKILAVGVAALLGTGMAGSAQAYYLGYANGDPGGWTFYQEQHNGASPPPVSETETPARSYARPHHHARIEYNGRMYLRHDMEEGPSHS
jgi:hypothetical protein